MNVRIPSPLRSYTNDAKNVTAHGTTIDDVLVDLDRQFPGLRFRVVDEQGALRRHMRIYVNSDMVRDLRTTVDDEDELHILQALSGG
ncbi:MAG: MoaD/ThiS family protein [Acidimicrobiia bacterium]